jgi:hypothetical protein
MQECPTCGDKRRVTMGDDVYPFLRRPCACEKTYPCRGKRGCKQPVAQVVLEADGFTVSEFRCQQHGSRLMFEEEPPKPPIRVRLEEPVFKTEGVTTGRISMAKGVPTPCNVPKPTAALSDEEVYAVLEAEIKNEPRDQNTRLRCTYCGNDHRPHQRAWIRSNENGRRGLVSTCPKCKKSGYVATL